MASSLEKKQIDELLAKQHAIAVRAQRRVDELERQNAHFLGQISSSLTVPTSAFGLSYARAYYGERASVFGMPIDAAVGLLLHGLAACFGISLDKGSQTAAKFLHDIANGALASWTASLGAELGAKKRLERPALPPPNTGAEETPVHAPRPMTHEELAEAVAAMRSMAKPAMPERLPAPMPPPAPLPPPVQQKTSPAMPERPPAPPALHAPPPMPAQQETSLPPITKSVAAKVPAQTPAQWTLDPEAEMRALLQSHGAPSDPKTVTFFLSHENPGEAFRAMVRGAGASATKATAPSAPQKPNRVTPKWVLDPEAEMCRLLRSYGAPSDPKTVAYVLKHENAIEGIRAIVGGAQVPTTTAVAAKAPTSAPVPQPSTPPQSSLNAPPTTKKKSRRSLAAARTVGITEAAFAASPQMPPKANPKELPNQFAQDSNHAVPISQGELEAAERWRLLTAA